MFLQATGAAAFADLAVVNGLRIQGACTAGSPELQAQTQTDNAAVISLGDGSGAKYATWDSNFDVGNQELLTNATTRDAAIFNVTYASAAGLVATAVLGVEADPEGFDCLIFGTATQAGP